MKATTRKINQLFIDLTKSITLRKLSFYTRNFKHIEQILEQLYEEQIILGYEKVNLLTYQYKIYLKIQTSGAFLRPQTEFHSRPGRRVFIRLKNLKKLEEWQKLNRVGFVRTRLGFLTLRNCLKLKIGGELLVLIK